VQAVEIEGREKKSEAASDERRPAFRDSPNMSAGKSAHTVEGSRQGTFQFIYRLSVRHWADKVARGLYSQRMTHYTFRIRQGSHSSDVPVDLPDDGAAWDEAAMACSDMIRDTVARLGDSPEWRLEVADGSGTIRHLFRLTAESFDP